MITAHRIYVRQPQPHDLIDDPIDVCGIGTGFEGSFSARVRDAHGNEIASVPNVQAGGSGILGNFHVAIATGVPATPHGTLEVFEFAASGDGSELNKVIVPIVFGRALLDPYHGFGLHTVAAGETLSKIAQQRYGDGAVWSRIFEANRDQLNNPNLIFPSQVLRIPQ